MEEQKSMSQTVEQAASGEAEEERALSPDEEMVELEKLLSEEPDDFLPSHGVGEVQLHDHVRRRQTERDEIAHRVELGAELGAAGLRQTGQLAVEDVEDHAEEDQVGGQPEVVEVVAVRSEEVRCQAG